MKDYRKLYYEARLKIEDLEDDIQGYLEGEEHYFKKYQKLRELIERQGGVLALMSGKMYLMHNN